MGTATTSATTEITMKLQLQNPDKKIKKKVHTTENTFSSELMMEPEDYKEFSTKELPENETIESNVRKEKDDETDSLTTEIKTEQKKKKKKKVLSLIPLL